jgi:hypothetical protein
LGAENRDIPGRAGIVARVDIDHGLPMFYKGTNLARVNDLAFRDGMTYEIDGEALLELPLEVRS